MYSYMNSPQLDLSNRWLKPCSVLYLGNYTTWPSPNSCPVFTVYILDEGPHLYHYVGIKRKQVNTGNLLPCILNRPAYDVSENQTLKKQMKITNGFEFKQINWVYLRWIKDIPPDSDLPSPFYLTPSGCQIWRRIHVSVAGCRRRGSTVFVIPIFQKCR